MFIKMDPTLPVFFAIEDIINTTGDRMLSVWYVKNSKGGHYKRIQILCQHCHETYKIYWYFFKMGERCPCQNLKR
jgi:hypothetical protein